MVRVPADQLGQIDSLLLHQLLGGVQLVPQLALHLAHVGPGVHFVRLDVLNLFLCLVLLRLASFEVLNQVGILWTLNDHLSNFLRRLDLIHLHLVLESLLNDLCNGHVVNLLLRIQLGLTDGLEAAGRVRLQEHLILRLLRVLQLVERLVAFLKLHLRHGRLLTLLLALILNKYLLKVLL